MNQYNTKHIELKHNGVKVPYTAFNIERSEDGRDGMSFIVENFPSDEPNGYAVYFKGAEFVNGAFNPQLIELEKQDDGSLKIYAWQ